MLFVALPSALIISVVFSTFPLGTLGYMSKSIPLLIQSGFRKMTIYSFLIYYWKVVYVCGIFRLGIHTYTNFHEKFDPSSCNLLHYSSKI